MPPHFDRYSTCQLSEINVQHSIDKITIKCGSLFANLFKCVWHNVVVMIVVFLLFTHSIFQCLCAMIPPSSIQHGSSFIFVVVGRLLPPVFSQFFATHKNFFFQRLNIDRFLVLFCFAVLQHPNRACCAARCHESIIYACAWSIVSRVFSRVHFLKYQNYDDRNELVCSVRMYDRRAWPEMVTAYTTRLQNTLWSM